MTKFKTLALAGLLVALLLVSITQAWAATMKFRIVYFHTRVETIEVGDVEAHNLYSGESTGLGTLETGELAVAALKWFADYTTGAGPVLVAYIRLTFEDGSTIDFKGKLNTRPDPKGKGSLFEAGTAEIYQGSGRYAGIKGTGTSTGRRFAPLGAKAQCYLDYVLTYTVP
jgi:hypothetical protein